MCCRHCAGCCWCCWFLVLGSGCYGFDTEAVLMWHWKLMNHWICTYSSGSCLLDPSPLSFASLEKAFVRWSICLAKAFLGCIFHWHDSQYMETTHVPNHQSVLLRFINNFANYGAPPCTYHIPSHTIITTHEASHRSPFVKVQLPFRLSGTCPRRGRHCIPVLRTVPRNLKDLDAHPPVN